MRERPRDARSLPGSFTFFIPVRCDGPVPRRGPIRPFQVLSASSPSTPGPRRTFISLRWNDEIGGWPRVSPQTPRRLSPDQTGHVGEPVARVDRVRQLDEPAGGVVIAAD